MNKRNTILGIVAIALLSIFCACNSTPESKLKGKWIAEKVNVNFDEMKSSVEMINQVAETEKKTVLEFVNDSTLDISDGAVTHRTIFELTADGKIFYRFENGLPTMQELGIYQENTITTNSSTPLGTIEVIFKKK